MTGFSSKLPKGVRRLIQLPRTRARMLREVDDEVRAHLEMRVADLEARGMSESEARAEALRRFGDAGEYQAAEQRRVARQARRLGMREWLGDAWRDLAYTWRGLRRSPGLTASVVVILALGLGANAAVFSLLDRVFLQAPPGVTTPGGVKRVYFAQPQQQGPPDRPNGASERATYREFAAIQHAVAPTARLAAYAPPDSVELHLGDATLPAMRSYATRSYFNVLGARPALGRGFAPDEDRVDAARPIAVISDALWHRAFAGDPRVIGKKIGIGDRSYSVIGVAPPTFAGIDLDRVDLWLPLGDLPTPPVVSGPWYMSWYAPLQVIARPRSHALDRQLEAPATAAYRRTRQAEGTHDTTSSVLTGPIHAALGPGVRDDAVAVAIRIAGVSLMLLLIAIANVANLLLVRGMRRRREIAIRRALGASRTRLGGQVIAESVLLSALGAVAAVLIGILGGFALRRLVMPDVHWSSEAGDLRLVVFVAAAGLLGAILAGGAPAWRAARLDVNAALKAGLRTRAWERAWGRTGLIMLQVTLSLVLIVGAGLFLRSVRSVGEISMGFDPHGLFTVDARFGFDGPARTTEVNAALEAVGAELARLPGVQQTAISSPAPLRGAYRIGLHLARGDEVPTLDGAGPFAIRVSPQYFATTRVRIIAGRAFAPADGRASAPVAIVDQTMAHVLWPGKDPLGQCLRMPTSTSPCATVVGVAEDAHLMSVVEPTRLMEVYLPVAQQSWLDYPTSPYRYRALLVRASPDAEQRAMAFARRDLEARLPGLAMLRVEDMDQTMAPYVRPWQLGAILFSILGALAAIIAALGVYSLTAYAASQRTHEVSVRMALGARGWDVLLLIARDGLGVVSAGTLIGIAMAMLMGRLVATLLYGVSAHDPAVLMSAALGIAFVGFVASVTPGLRAARADPASALRAE